MLQSFSDRIRGNKWLGYTIVLLIAIPFALWGIQAYVGGGAPDVAAKVNGEPIPSYRVERQLSQRRQTLREQIGGELPEAFSDALLRDRVVDELITRELLRQVAADAGFRIPDAALSNRIRSQSSFRRDGSFSRDLYRQVLRQSGLTPQQYEARVRAGYRLEQLRQGVAETAFVLPAEARLLARLERQERRVATVQYPRDAARDAVEVDDEAIREYYRAHRERYRTPEQVRLAYVELDIGSLMAQVEVTEEELRRAYEARHEQDRTQAARKASHILIEVPSGATDEAWREARRKAERLRERLADGAAFADLARKHSDDPGSADAGGDLGYITRGTMVEPFEEELFELPEPGAVSDPVRTRYGFHLIRLEGIRQEESKSFEAVRDQLERELKRRRAERRFYDRVEVLRNAAYENPDGLEPVADATGLEIRRSGWISRESGEGIGQHAPVRKAAFSDDALAHRRNSDVIELGQRRIAVVRVLDHREPEPKPLQSVRTKVRETLVDERTTKRLHAWSGEVISRLDGGAAPRAVAKAPARLIAHGWITRAGSDIDRRIQAAAFELESPGEGSYGYRAVTLASGARAIVVVDAVRLPEVADETVAETREKRRRRVSRGELGAWIAALKADADIQRFDERSDRGGS